jgi:hypothetical protein
MIPVVLNMTVNSWIKAAFGESNVCIKQQYLRRFLFVVYHWIPAVLNMAINSWIKAAFGEVTILVRQYTAGGYAAVAVHGVVAAALSMAINSLIKAAFGKYKRMAACSWRCQSGDFACCHVLKADSFNTHENDTLCEPPPNQEYIYLI